MSEDRAKKETETERGELNQLDAFDVRFTNSKINDIFRSSAFQTGNKNLLKYLYTLNLARKKK